MARLIYGIGLNFGNSRNGYYSVSADKKLIKENVINILMTRPGERIHLPNYGVGVDAYLFEPNDSILESLLRNKIIDQVNKWEPGVTILNVEFTRNENELNIRLTVQMVDFGNSVEQINYSIRG